MMQVVPSVDLLASSDTAHLLSEWWTRPDADRLNLWARPEYREEVLELWREVMGSATQSVQGLLNAVAGERDALVEEYERLFVGPGTVPCPPYEAVWRTDRPKHEQWTVMGGSTTRMQQIYAELGVRLHPGQVELPDHISIELEALAHAWRTNRVSQANALVELFQGWLPAFAGAVVANSELEFYRKLAELTWEFFVHCRRTRMPDPPLRP